MSDLKICRICLRTECKVYKFDRYQLKPYYEEVMAMKVNEKDGLPHYFCYECATMLHKFHKFKEKCYVGQKVLKEISWRGGVTYEAVYKVDRASNNLKSPLEILTVLGKRVKTYITKDSTEISDSETESVALLRNFEVQFVSEDSITDRDDIMDPENDPVDEISNNIVLIPEIDMKETENDSLPENTDAVDNQDDNLNVDETLANEKDLQDEDDKPLVDLNVSKSPTTVFVNVKKEIVHLKREKIKGRQRSYDAYGLKRQNPSFAKKRTRFLDTNNWKKFNLSEEEAVDEFRKRAFDSKYDAAAFKCTDCFRGFSKEEMLKRHKQLRHSETLGTLDCRFCHMRFKWDCHLRKHMRQHFTKYKCLRCNLVCSIENTALLHEEYHNGVLKKCIHCGEEFKHTSTYYTHLRTHRSDYVCTLCGVSFVSPLGLHQHKKVKHVNNEIDSPDDDDEVNTHCEKCDVRFETRKAYEEHLFHSAMHTEGVEDELDEISIPRKVLGKKLQQMITSELKGKKCEEDSMTPPPRKRKRKIKRLHRKPTTCYQCGKHFDTQAACMKHHQSEHPRTSFFAQNERHICEICGASLAPGSVATHQNMHSRQKVHPCETCGRTFHSSVGLKRHLVTHTGEKPYPCSLCDKRFTQSNSMKLHYRTYHLKQPYPKRNRRKKKDDPPETTEPEDKSGGSEESDESSREPEATAPERGVEPATDGTQDTMHYLTLS